MITAPQAVTTTIATEVVTATKAAKAATTAGQPTSQNTSARKDRSPAYQPGDYEQDVVQKRKRNEDKLKELSLSGSLIKPSKRPWLQTSTTTTEADATSTVLETYHSPLKLISLLDQIMQQMKVLVLLHMVLSHLVTAF